MAFRINHIHIKTRDPRKTAEWFVNNLGAKIAAENRNGDKIAIQIGGDLCRSGSIISILKPAIRERPPSGSSTILGRKSRPKIATATKSRSKSEVTYVVQDQSYPY